MEPHYYLLRERNYLPASCVDILLGRIVQNYGVPTALFCPLESAHLEKGTLIRTSMHNFLIKGLGSSSKGPKIDMQGVLGLECTLKRSYEVDLTGEVLTSIRPQRHSELVSNDDAGGKREGPDDVVDDEMAVQRTTCVHGGRIVAL